MHGFLTVTVKKRCPVYCIIAKSYVILCGYHTSQTTCSLLCNIIYSLIFCYYKHFCLLRSSYRVSRGHHSHVREPLLNNQANRCRHQGLLRHLQDVEHDLSYSFKLTLSMIDTHRLMWITWFYKCLDCLFGAWNLASLIVRIELLSKKVI